MLNLLNNVPLVPNCYSSDREKQQALDAWVRKLKSIISGVPVGKVLPMMRSVAE